MLIVWRVIAILLTRESPYQRLNNRPDSRLKTKPKFKVLMLIALVEGFCACGKLLKMRYGVGEREGCARNEWAERVRNALA